MMRDECSTASRRPYVVAEGCEGEVRHQIYTINNYMGLKRLTLHGATRVNDQNA